MANTQRRKDYTDRSGNMFIPINVEGGNYNESFFTTTKLVTIIIILGLLALLIFYIKSLNANALGYIIYIGIYLFIASFAVRFIIFEEKFYYRMYKVLQKHKITSPALFWNITSIKDTDDGAILNYADGKVAVMIRVDRDTITGKEPSFKETHYDALSDFYRELVLNRFCWVQMNIMEPAGKDPRLNELSKLVYKSDNPNIQKLMELEVGHIKSISRKSLYESDYFLIYTNDITRVDTIIADVTECIFKLLEGAYISYSILGSKDIAESVKERRGVNYFNYAQASLQMFTDSNMQIAAPFNIKGIEWTDGEYQELNPSELNKLRYTTSGVIRETIDPEKVSLKDTIYRKEEKIKVGIDFSDLSKTAQKKVPQQQSSAKKTLLSKDKNGAKSTTQTKKATSNTTDETTGGNAKVTLSKDTVSTAPKNTSTGNNDDDFIDF